MNVKKKASELVFNLQWSSKPDNGSDKSNVIGMYDTPVTTSNFERFKSYLLKNSGVAANDVKVTYITDSGQDWVIDSQEWFEIALSAFRLKARLGEVIFLKLDKVISRKNSNVNVETQSDSSGPSSMDTPPEWFINYMKQFKRDIVDEINFGVSSMIMTNLAKSKEVGSPPPVTPPTTTTKKVKDLVEEIHFGVSPTIMPNSTKSKEVIPPSPTIITKKVKDPTRRSRRLHHHALGEPVERVEKSTLKALATERKLDLKLDRLEVKTKKLKEKKHALVSKENAKEAEKPSGLDMYKLADHLWEKYQVSRTIDGSPLLDATTVLVGDENPYVTMCGGEVYLHSWNVMNNGQVPWSPDTELRMAWGSEELKPSVKSIRCPRLKPGEKGSITVCFQIPKKSGRYETHWNFYLGYIRFGRTLNCTVIVSSPVLTILDEKPKTQLKHCGTDPMIFYSKYERPDFKESPDDAVFSPETKTYRVGFGQPEHTIVSGKNEEPRLSVRVLKPSVYVQPCPEPTLTPYGTIKAENVDGAMDLSKKMERMLNSLKYDISDRETSPEKMPMSYGINENELLVDLSQGAEENKTEKQVKVEETEPVEMKLEINTNEDNNNNETLTNNNSSGESISEVASVASDHSDLSSGYDVLNVPECEEKEEASGYVYITIDGNKLPVPKHILRPDFVANAEEAPGPVNSEDEEKPCTPINTMKESVKTEETSRTSFTGIQGATNMEDMLVQCTLNDDPNTSGRLFIFPQTTPGFEVVNPVRESTQNGDGAEQAAGIDNTWTPSKTCYAVEECGIAQLDDIYLQANDLANAGYYIPPPHRHIPNYQQTLPDERPPPVGRKEQNATSPTPSPTAPPKTVTKTEQSPVQGVPVHILPENLVSGAVNVASSAINTARSVINMIVPPKNEGGKWVNGHWVTENQESQRAKSLSILHEMGFWNEDLNATLLARFNDDVARVISELIS